MNVVSWSGGKDSTATIILAHENGIKIDRIVMSMPFFDKARNIYADHPDHVKWVLEYAKPLFESWGYRVDVVSDDKDYLYHFYYVVNKAKNPDRNGKYRGFLIGGLCKLNGSKVDPIKRYLKGLGSNVIMFEGIAADEPQRLEGMHQKRGHRSLLEEYGVTEIQTYPICTKYGLLSPRYQRRTRQGCWFCPNQGYEEFADLKQDYPQYWQELKTLSKVENKVSECFKYDKTFDEVEARVDKIIEMRNNEPEQIRFEF